MCLCDVAAMLRRRLSGAVAEGVMTTAADGG